MISAAAAQQVGPDKQRRIGLNDITNVRAGAWSWSDDESSMPVKRSKLALINQNSGGITSSYMLKRFDRGVEVRSLIMFVLSIAVIILMVIWGQTNDDGVLIGSRRVDKQFGVSVITIEIIMAGIVLVHVLMAFEYYMYQRKWESRSWFVLDSLEWKNHRWKFFLLEVFILLLFPYPGLPLRVGRYLQVFTFFRFYAVFRVLKVNNPSYQERFVIMNNPSFRAVGAVEFNWAFALRSLILTHSWWVTIGFAAFFFATLSYSLYIFERITPPDQGSGPWTMAMAAWNIVITATTVGYGDISAYSQEGRFVASLTAITGVSLSSLLIFVLFNTLSLNPLEKHADALKDARWWNGRVKWVAICYIQLWMRNKLYWKKFGKSMPGFFHENQRLKALFRECRRRIGLIPLDGITAVEEVHGDESDSDSEATEKEDPAERHIKNLKLEQAEMRSALDYINKTQRMILQHLGTKHLPKEFHWIPDKPKRKRGKKPKPMSLEETVFVAAKMDPPHLKSKGDGHHHDSKHGGDKKHGGADDKHAKKGHGAKGHGGNTKKKHNPSASASASASYSVHSAPYGSDAYGSEPEYSGYYSGSD